MLIKVLPENSLSYKDENHHSGDVIDMEESQAYKFIADGRAIECSIPKPEEIIEEQINLEKEE